MMNPSSAGLWNNPPPPGMEIEDVTKPDNRPTLTDENVNFDTTTMTTIIKTDCQVRKNDHERSHHRHRRNSRSRSRERHRSRSKSRERKKKRHRSKSRSRRHRRTSRSRSRCTHRRRYSSSRSRSRSSSYEKARHKHRRDKRRRSRSRRYSRSRSRSSSYRHCRNRRYSRERENYCNPYPPERVEDKDEDDDLEEPAKELPFKNDGTFLEMFKKMQEEQQQAETSKSVDETKKNLPVFGKRRGGRVLKTGLVQKNKNSQQDDVTDVQDPWSIYLKEVKRYKEACCDDDSKTRPLVK